MLETSLLHTGLCGTWARSDHQTWSWIHCPPVLQFCFSAIMEKGNMKAFFSPCKEKKWGEGDYLNTPHSHCTHCIVFPVETPCWFLNPFKPTGTCMAWIQELLLSLSLFISSHIGVSVMVSGSWFSWKFQSFQKFSSFLHRTRSMHCLDLIFFFQRCFPLLVLLLDKIVSWHNWIVPL